MSVKHILNVLQTPIETLEMYDFIISGSATSSTSEFQPGNTIDERKLVCRLRSDVPFPVGTRLLLRLVAVTDAANAKTPVVVSITREKVVKRFDTHFDIILTSRDIPLPVGILFLPTTAPACTLEALHLVNGSVARYHFILSVASRYCHPQQYVEPGIPLIGKVVSGALCDVKCERLEFSDVQDADHTIKIVCDSRIVYAKPPHCVTHCQAPKPIIQYYDASSVGQSHSVPCNCC